MHGLSKWTLKSRSIEISWKELKMKLSRVVFRTLPLQAALALAFASQASQAQSLIELYENARGYDATYVGARAQYEANLAHANQALGGVLPNVALNATTTRNYWDYRPDAPTAIGTQPGPEAIRYYSTSQASLNFTQALYRPMVWDTYKQSGPQMQQALALYEAAEQDLLVRVSQAYFDVLNSEDSLELIRAQKRAVGEQLASAKRNFEVGTSTITGVRDAQARYDLSVAQEVAAENDLRVKHLALDLVTGIKNASPKHLSNIKELIPAPKEDAETWVSQSEVTSPAVKQAKLNLDIARLEVHKAQSGHKPTLDAQISIQGIRNEGGGGNNSAYSSHIYNPSAALILNVPLFSGFAVQNRVKETVGLEQKAQADFDAATRNTAQATRTAYLGVISGLSQVAAYEAAEASSQSSLDANKLGYSVGVNINIDVLNAQSQLYQTKRDLAKARYDVLVGKLKLLQAVGTLTPQDLQPINNLLQP
jgi:outer membrane protein